jgi:thiamine-monophosphate kinase
MNHEREMIDLISGFMPRSARQKNRIHESDSEILEYQGKTILFSMDEFSDEDRMRTDNPFNLGWNCAIGGISDILASGGKPLFYAHSLTVAGHWGKNYVQQFAGGVAAALKEFQTPFIGGDFGSSGQWRYTVAVLGEPLRKPLLRTMAGTGDGIYLSGRIGAGNFEAVLNLFSTNRLLQKMTKPIQNRFHPRHKETALISEYASACIDTSDGVLNAMNCLAEMSRKGYCLRQLPFIRSGRAAARVLKLSHLLLFMAECGEYELLFTIPQPREIQFIKAAAKNKFRFYRIGEITDSGEKTLIEKARRIHFDSFNIRARDFADMKNYISALNHFLGKA